MSLCCLFIVLSVSVYRHRGMCINVVETVEVIVGLRFGSDITCDKPALRVLQHYQLSFSRYKLVSFLFT